MVFVDVVVLVVVDVVIVVVGAAVFLYFISGQGVRQNNIGVSFINDTVVEPVSGYPLTPATTIDKIVMKCS